MELGRLYRVLTPLRLEILQMLAEGDRSPGTLELEFGDRTTVMYDLSVLVKAGLIVRDVVELDTLSRPHRTMYRLIREPLIEMGKQLLHIGLYPDLIMITEEAPDWEKHG